MIWLDRLAWSTILRRLESYCRRNTNVRHCFIRHSTASGPQNFWVSDYDLVFFVQAASFQEVNKRAASIRRDLKKAIVLDAIVLPASPAAYRLCASHYPLRSLYPMSSWRRIYGEPITLPATPSVPLPLDHAPESFLYSYLTPVLKGKMRRHFAQATLMQRKLEREHLQFGRPIPSAYPSELYEVVAHNIRFWDQFYRGLSFPPQQEPVVVRPTRRQSHLAFASQWAKADLPAVARRGVDSVWVYPSSHQDHKPHLLVNLKPAASREECRTAIRALLKMFRGLEFDLLLGTQASMRGRLRGLSRVALFEPWLCKAFGHCLYGDRNAAQEIQEPLFQELQQKLREFFLYLSYRTFSGGWYPYSLYRLCFTLDHLFKSRELVVDSEDLAVVYGRDFLQEFQFDGWERNKHVLDAWKNLHALSLF
jgi:hypothetical protein